MEKSSGAAAQTVDFLQLKQVQGRMCEVRKAETNALIFVGRILHVDDHSFSVFPTTRAEAPPVLFNAPFKLIIHMADGSAKAWRGLICGSSPFFWRFDRFTSLHGNEMRSTFRQAVSRPITVIYLDPEVENEEELERCSGELVDISMSGMQICVGQQYEVGSCLTVADLHLSSAKSPPYRFTGKVCWIRPGANGTAFCGLRFLPLPVAMEDRLCSEIFHLQRLDIMARREQK